MTHTVTLTPKTAAIVMASGEVQHLSHRKKIKLEFAQEIVGGWVEMLKISATHIMLCDDEGLLKNKPTNSAATALAHDAGLLHPHGRIAGNVIICRSEQF